LIPEDPIVEPEQATALFRIFQEALTNVVRHADARTVEVRLTQHSASLGLEIHDDGKGIAANRLSDCTSLGLLSMRERAQLWGGEVQITGNPRSGTTVVVQLPSNDGERQGMAS
jgi:signal transduction histidine kinase